MAKFQVTIDSTQRPLIEGLTNVLAQLKGRDAEFASSLIQNFYRFGKLSEKQLPWVTTLTERVTKPAAAPVAAETVSVAAINALFDKAAIKLKRVKVKLATETSPVVFARAGAMSKYCGQILITDGGPFGDNLYFGRIDINGEFFPTRNADDSVKGLIREFADNPSDTAGKYGRLTGGCSFCNKPLKDERSTSVGYGPICAENFGLKWG
jgi:hypothetical protein